ncbi:CAP domain-containing protein [Geopyxis carbonaria]|nr:CAP domain-containing protein [Geopyxis carbonaria]
MPMNIKNILTVYIRVTETAAPVTVQVQAMQDVIVTKTAQAVVTVTRGVRKAWRRPRPTYVAPVVVSEPAPVETPSSTPVSVVVMTPSSTPDVVAETPAYTPPAETTSVAPTTSAEPARSSSSNFGLDTAKILDLHNSFRAKHNAAALTWDDTLAESALKHSSGCIFEHTGMGVYENVSRKYGQNLWVSTVIPKSDVDLSEAFSSWAENEIPFYTGGFSEEAGHLTQVVWKSTTKLGCALYQCNDKISGRVNYQSGSLLTCEYDPSGNVEGQYATEVSL